MNLGVLLITLASVAGAASPPDTLSTQQANILVYPVSHATFVLKWSETTVFVDPVGGAGAFSGQATPDVILITDIHGDHLDGETIGAVRGPGTVIVAPRAAFERLGGAEQEATVVLANGSATEQAGISIEAIPMYNLTEGRLDFHVKGRGNGYVITLGGSRIYISGDTEDVPEMRGLKDIDAAFICMNLPYTMEVEEAADAVLEFGPKVVYPYHYRGGGGMSDVGRFRELVASNPDIEVRQLEWYP